MTPLERRYRRWMVAYPAGYRREHESEILDTLLQSAGPGQDRPSLREGLALLSGGLRTRARLAVASPGRVWADGLRLGAVLYLVLACGTRLSSSLGPILFPGRMGLGREADLVHLEVAVLAIVVVAVLRARYEIGLAALAGFVAISEIALRSVAVPVPPAPVNWLLVAAAVAALAWHPRLRALRRPWPAGPALLALGGVGLAAASYLAMDTVAVHRSALALPLMVASPPLLLPVAVLLLLAVVGADPRPALAATVYVLANAVGLAQLGFSIRLAGFDGILYGLQLLESAGAAALALAVTVVSARRLART
jgi:hypothetical protein